MGGFIKNSKVRIDGGGWNLRSESNDVKVLLFPFVARGRSNLFDGVDNFGPLYLVSKCHCSFAQQEVLIG